MAKIQFFTQKMIEKWAQEKKVHFDGNTLEVLIGKTVSYVLKPATRFLKLVEGEDTLGIKRKVLTKEHLDSLGADLYMNSVIIGETAYEVEPGFIVEGMTSGQTSQKEFEDSLAEFMLKAMDKTS